MLNGLFVFIALASVLFAAVTSQMQPLTDAIITSARDAVDLAIGLIGIMAFFLGLMRGRLRRGVDGEHLTGREPGHATALPVGARR